MEKDLVRQYSEALAGAEARWHEGKRDEAVEYYDEALRAAEEIGEVDRVGMTLLGKGFALLHLGDADRAVPSLEGALQIAVDSEEAAQVAFLETLLGQAKSQRGPVSEPAVEMPSKADHGENVEQGTMNALVKALVVRDAVVIAMKGTPSDPQCVFSKRAADSLAALRVRFRYVDVNSDARLREAFKQLGKWPTFPQVYVCGALFGGIDIIDELMAEEELLQALGESLSLGGVQVATVVASLEDEYNDLTKTAPKAKKGDCADPGDHFQRLVDAAVSVARRFIDKNDIPEDVPLRPSTSSPASHSLGFTSLQALAFVDALAETLGGISLPSDMIVDGETTLRDVARIVEDNCPADGVCSACPTKTTCSVHNGGDATDIEDLLPHAPPESTAREDTPDVIGAERASLTSGRAKVELVV